METVNWHMFRAGNRKSGYYHVIGSRVLPIGDFDGGRPELDEPSRVYRTKNGWRAFYIGRFAPDLSRMLKKIVSDGSDPRYARSAKAIGFYTARLEPKGLAKSQELCPSKSTQFLFENGERNPAWDEFIAIHDLWTSALAHGDPQ